MSDFLLIVPSGWTEIPNDPVWIGVTIEVTDLTFTIASESWGDLDNILSSMVILPEGKNVTNARMIATETGYRLWVLYNS